MASSFVEMGQNPSARFVVLAGLLEEQRDRWVLFAPVALGVGIALWFLLPWNPQRQAALVLGLAIALGGFALSGLARRAVVIAGLLLALGVGVADLRSQMVAGPRLHHRLTAEEMHGTVGAVAITSGAERSRILMDRDASDIDPTVRLRITLTGPPPPGIEPGARIAVTAPLAPVAGPTLPGSYDPARRAWFDQIAASGRAFAPPRLLQAAQGADSGLDRMRGKLARHIDRGLGGGDAGAIAVALVVGEQGRISPPLVDSFRLSGLAHILTVSGFHVAVVVGGMFFLLRRLFALWPWLALRFPAMRMAAIGAGIAGTVYTLVAGADVPAVRSAIVAWVVLLGMMMGRDPVSLRLLGFAACLILLIQPEAITNPSFQLSFAAVAALITLSQSSLGKRLARDGDDGLLIRLGKALALLILTGLVVEATLLPIALAHFGRTGAYGTLANMAAIPLTTFVIMPLLGLWLLFSALGLGVLVGWALVPSLDLLATIATTVSGLPGSSVAVPAMSGLAFGLMAMGGLVVALFAGQLRLAGAPLLAAGLLLALFQPRPDVFVSADARQVGILQNGRLYMLRNHRGGYVANSWAERAAASADRRVADLPGARCGAQYCAVKLDGVRLLLLTEDGDHAARPSARLCAGFDVVVAPVALPAACQPRWQRLDPAFLRASGAVSIIARARRMDSVAARAGDQPWSPSALPGWMPRLLGGPAWTGVVAE